MSTTPDKFKIVRAICYKCAEFFDQPAGGKVHGTVARCPACEQVDTWMQELSNDCA